MSYAIGLLLISPGRWLQAKTHQPIVVVSLVIIHVNGVDGFLVFYTNLTFKVQKGRGLGSHDPIKKFWDPLISFEGIVLSASNLVQT